MKKNLTQETRAMGYQPLPSVSAEERRERNVQGLMDCVRLELAIYNESRAASVIECYERLIREGFDKLKKERTNGKDA
jgi:hypothetical protein